MRAMLEIALDKSGKGVFQKDIASNQDISIKYLDHIIHALKAAGLINTIRGKKSGYVLTRLPSEISMYDIHNAFENGICVIDCMSEDYVCEKDGKCETQVFWHGLNVIVEEYFRKTSLKDIMNDQKIIQ